MARIRTIKPGYFTNEALADLEPLTRLLFIGLWCIADRDGRLEDRPKRIRAEILPYDDGSVDGMLQALHEAGFIVRYARDGKRYIQVVNFGRHQRPHHKESPSTIPPLGEYLPRHVPAPTQASASTDLAPHQPAGGNGEWRMENGGGGNGGNGGDAHDETFHGDPPPPPSPTLIEDQITRQVEPILRTPPRERRLLASVIARHRTRGLSADDITLEAEKLASKDGKPITARSFERWLARASPGSVLLRPTNNASSVPHIAITADQANPFRTARGPSA